MEDNDDVGVGAVAVSRDFQSGLIWPWNWSNMAFKVVRYEFMDCHIGPLWNRRHHPQRRCLFQHSHMHFLAFWARILLKLAFHIIMLLTLRFHAPLGIMRYSVYLHREILEIIIPEGEYRDWWPRLATEHRGMSQGAKPRGASRGVRSPVEVTSRGPLLKGDYPVSRGVGGQNNILS